MAATPGPTARRVYDERRAHVAAAEIVAAYVADATEAERVEQERKEAGVTFREVAHEYLDWLEDVKGAKPSTLRDHRSTLAEPGTAYIGVAAAPSTGM